MKEVRFAFYLAKFEWRNIYKKGKKLHFYDDGISWWTCLFNWGTPGVSHVETWIQCENPRNMSFDKFKSMIPQGNPQFAHCSPPKKEPIAGTCYTSTMRGDENGTVSRPASEVFTHPERWLILKFQVTDESFEEAKAWADKRVAGNHKYSMKDIRRFFMPLWMLKWLKWDDPKREICSEHAEGWAIRLLLPLMVHQYPMLLKILIRSPRRLWRDLVRRHHVATYSLATGKMVYDENGKRCG